MEYKLFDSELKVLEILWDGGQMPAREIADQAEQQVGWSRTTTYTVLKKCVEKGLISRQEPGFRCEARITRQQAQQQETKGLIDRMYGGSVSYLMASLLDGDALSSEEITRLRKMVEDLK